MQDRTAQSGSGTLQAAPRAAGRGLPARLRRRPASRALPLLRLVLLAGFACLGTGCAGLTGPRDTGSWLEARGADFMDIFGVRLAVGPGLGVYVRATEYLQLGAMYRGPSEAQLVGAADSPGEDSFRVRGVPCLMFGTIGRWGGMWTERSREVMVPGYSNRDAPRSPIRRESIAGIVPEDGTADNWRASFGLGLQVVVLGAEAEVRPLQILDFLGGLVGYDPAGDDVPVLEGDAPDGG